MIKKIIFIFGILFFAGFVSAAVAGCCSETCTPVQRAIQCSGGFIPGLSSCDSLPGCKIGGCYYSDSGWCDSAGVAKKICEDNGGEVIAEGDSRCVMGCCSSLGRNTDIMTQSQCILKSEEMGVNPTFQSGVSAEECKYGSSVQGACLLSGSEFGANCRRMTGEECIASSGDFKEGDLCSKYYEQTGCKAEDYIGCALEEGMYDIYWYDSCDNRENIYLGNEKSEKRESNNSGRIMTPQEVAEAECDSEDCGICNYPRESICAPYEEKLGDNEVKAGDFYCKTLECFGAPKNGGGFEKKANQEEWCLFDAFIGKGKDPVGSEHYFMRCDNGEVKVDGDKFGERRAKLCVEGITPDRYSFTTSIENDYATCQSYNELSEEEMKIACEQSPSCIRMENICTGSSPPGFIFWSDTTDTSGQEALTELEIASCGKKEGGFSEGGIKLGGDDLRWNAEGEMEDSINEEGFKKWAFSRNNYCMSLGDCGDYINYLGVYGTARPPIVTKEDEGGTIDFFSDDEYLKYKPFCDEEGKIYDDLGEIDLDFSKPVEGQKVKTNAGYGITINGKDVYENEDDSANEQRITYSCNLWKAPSEGDCSKCNEDEKFRPCTEYKCRSIGSNCKSTSLASGQTTDGSSLEEDAVETDVNVCYSDEMCINPENILISGVQVPGGYSAFINENYKEVDISKDGLGGYIEENLVGLEIKFNTDNYANCAFSDMDPIFDFAEGTPISRIGEKEFSMSVNIPPTDDPNKIHGEEYNVYVRCKDVCDNPTFEPYKFVFKVQKTPDTTEPTIYTENPETGMPFGATESKLKVFGDELLSACRYSFNPAVPFDDMTENFEDCVEFSVDAEEYFCETTVSGLGGKDSQIIYIKCADHYQNKNLGDYLHTFVKSQSKLEINSFYPTEGLVFKKLTDNKINIAVTTTGGITPEGSSSCSWELLRGIKSFGEVEFLDNPIASHTFEWDYSIVFPDEYRIKFKCEDSAGNKATNTTKFTIEKDMIAPLVTRVVKEGSSIKLTTNEEAICYYDNSTMPSCGFITENGFAIDGTYGIDHSLVYEIGKTYYVKCKDAYGNANPSCAIIVKGSDY